MVLPLLILPAAMAVVVTAELRRLSIQLLIIITVGIVDWMGCGGRGYQGDLQAVDQGTSMAAKVILEGAKLRRRGSPKKLLRILWLHLHLHLL